MPERKRIDGSTRKKREKKLRTELNTPPPRPVHPGQVFQDNDPREKGVRFLRVIMTWQKILDKDEFAVMEPVILTPDGYRRKEGGRETRVSTSALHKEGTKGFKLVHDPKPDRGEQRPPSPLERILNGT